MKSYDVIVIGFGKAGKTLAGKLAKSGKKVALIEKDAFMYGGTCINVGCIPSKRLIIDAALSPDASFEEKAAYFKKSIEGKRQLTAALNQANYNKVAQAGAEIIDGVASFVDAKTINVKTADGDLTLTAEQFLINTGSTPVIPNIEGVRDPATGELQAGNKLYTSQTLMDLDELPERLTIVGGGYIGLEFASMFAEFGSKVTIIQDSDVFLPREDEDIVEVIREVISAKGVEVITGAAISAIKDGVVTYTADGATKELAGDAVLIATGRRPNTDELQAEKAGIKMTNRGAVETDEHLRTSVPNIWAAGDVVGKLQFTYISLDDYRIVLDDMMGNRQRTTENRGAFAYSVFIEPPFSRVGLNEKEAKAQGLEYRVLKMPANAIPKAKVLRETEGVLKALVAPNGKILGAQLFCAESHEMINMIKLAMDHDLGYDVLRDFIYNHPTMSESLNDLFAL